MISFCPEVTCEHNGKWIRENANGKVFFGRLIGCSKKGIDIFSCLSITLIVLGILAFTSVISGGIIAGSICLGLGLTILIPVILGYTRLKKI